MAAFIAGCVAASTSTGNGAGGLKFAIVWTIVVTFLVAAGGTRTVIKRDLHTPLTMGAFLGTMTVLSSQYLVLMAIFGGVAQEDDDDEAVRNNEAYAVSSLNESTMQLSD